MNRNRIAFAASALCAGLSIAAIGIAQDGAGKGAPKTPPTGPIPRAADGKPKIAGVWQAGGVSLLGEKGNPPKVAPPTVNVAQPRREQISYTPAFDPKRKGLTSNDDPSLYCLLPGVPRITGQPNPFEIVQTPEKVYIIYEVFHAARIIPLNSDLKHPDDLTPTWMGDSVAKWDGDTLVVDVRGFNDKTWLAGTGSIHSEDLHVQERYTVHSDNTMTYEVMAEDPQAFTKPWYTGSILRRTAPHIRVEEYECIENNQDVQHMKAGSAR